MEHDTHAWLSLFIRPSAASVVRLRSKEEVAALRPPAAKNISAARHPQHVSAGLVCDQINARIDLIHFSHITLSHPISLQRAPARETVDELLADLIQRVSSSAEEEPEQRQSRKNRLVCSQLPSTSVLSRRDIHSSGASSRILYFLSSIILLHLVFVGDSELLRVCYSA